MRSGTIDELSGEAVRQAGPRFVVAIPVRNEAERIGVCLRALAAQDAIGEDDLGVVLALDGCDDDTASIVAAMMPGLPFPLRIVERNAAPSAGGARREAMDVAAAWLARTGRTDGVLLTTDADTRVPPDWVARNLAALAAGADAIAGRFVLEEAEAASLPAALTARGRLEATYEALLTELDARIAPCPHDPWPRHWTTSGASLAVTLPAYRAAGGMPPLALGEDRAFVSALLASDARVRHDPAVIVVTSGRLHGRANGGAADTMRTRCDVPDSPCDPRLEPLGRALLRFAARRHLRRLHASGRLRRTSGWAHALGISRETALVVANLPGRGAVMGAAERASPWLAPRLLRPEDLPGQIRLARIALALVRTGDRLRGLIRRMTGRVAGPRRLRPAPAE